MNWLMIIGVLVIVAIVGGLIFGLLGDLLGLSPTMKIGGIGVLVGLVAAALLTRQRAAGNQENKT